MSATCAAAALTEADRDRLAAILGMLGSDHAGERDAAALAASRFLRIRRLTWPDVIGTPAQAPPRHPLRDLLCNWPERWRDAVHVCREAEARLADWDRKFIRTIAAYQHRPSARQLDILQTIAERLLSGGAS